MRKFYLSTIWDTDIMTPNGKSTPEQNGYLMYCLGLDLAVTEYKGRKKITCQ